MSTTSSSSKIQWAQPEDWAKFQNTITALFMCHSLPVLMRIMREEHKFNATAKMFQTQIYQKWGLRKTKPGEAKREAKREAKERKRRREESEEAESVSSSTRDRRHGRGRASTTAESMSIHDQSRKSQSPVPPHSSQMEFEDRYSVQPSLDVPTSHLADNEESSGSIRAISDAHSFVPPGWRTFLEHGQASNRPLEDKKPTPASVISGSQNGSEHLSLEGVPPLTNDSGTWISTVMTPTHGTNLHTYAESHSSQSSMRSNVLPLRASPSHDEEAPAPPKKKRAKLEAPVFQMPLSLIRQLESPDTLLIPEKSMFVARHYISTTFSTGAWALTQSTDASFFDKECSKLEHWYNDFNPAFEFLKEQKVTKAFRLFKRCFANTKSIIEPQDPRVVIYVFQQVIRCMYYDNLGRGLSQTLLKYITGLCQVLFGVQHPLYIMLHQLSKLDSFAFAQNMRPFMDCYFDHLEPFLERSSNAFGHITEMRGLTVSLMEGTGMMGIYEAKPIMDTLVRKAKNLGLSSLHLRVETAAILHRNRFFNEAIVLLDEVRGSEEGMTSPYEWVYAGIVLMLTYRKMRDADGVIRVGYELVEFLTKPLSMNLGPPSEMSMSLRQYIGSRQSSFLLVLGKLEKELRESGRIDEADRIQARLDRGISHEYGVDYGNHEFDDRDPVEEVNRMVQAQEQ